MDQIPFGTDDFAENPEPRVPCILILDVSGSMTGEPIAELNDGLAAYKEELSEDSLASKRVEVCVITFGTTVTTACEFSTAENFHPPLLEAGGATPMGEAVNRAIDLLEERKQQYKAAGISYYRPWLFLVSDGSPTDSSVWPAAASRALQAERGKAFKMFCVGVEGADLQTLGKFSEGEPVMLKGLRFRDMFEWLSSSQQSVSRSTPGEEVPLENPASPSGWASIS